MPETEQEHVERVMKHLNVKTVVVTTSESLAEHVYINGKLMPGIPDLDPEEPHVVCEANGQADWDCAVYSTGVGLPQHLEREESI
jgi:hypothetical protein